MSIEEAKKEILNSYQEIGGINHIEGINLPSWDSIHDILTILKKILFPGFFGQESVTKASIGPILETHLIALHATLSQELLKSMLSVKKEAQKRDADAICKEFFAFIPELRSTLKKDIDAIYQGDPAASSDAEIILAYQGFHAITIYRIAHFFYKKNIPLIPRLMSEIAHSQTGVEIHPGATIGTHFCIDHGTGIVIGGTSTIGNYVKIYQGVTLGALSVPDRNTNGKRHPTIEDYVTIYSGATILGGNTIIGHHSTIGGNVWLTKSVAHHSKIFMMPSANRKQVELSSDPQI